MVHKAVSMMNNLGEKFSRIGHDIFPRQPGEPNNKTRKIHTDDILAV